MSRRRRGPPPAERSKRCENSASCSHPPASRVSADRHSFARSGAAFEQRLDGGLRQLEGVEPVVDGVRLGGEPARHEAAERGEDLHAPRGVLGEALVEPAWPSSSLSRGASSTARSSPSSFSSRSPVGEAMMACAAAHAFSRLPDLVSLACSARKCRESRFSASRSAFFWASSEVGRNSPANSGSPAMTRTRATCRRVRRRCGLRGLGLEARDRDLGQRAAGDRLAENPRQRREVLPGQSRRGAGDDGCRARDCGAQRKRRRVRSAGSRGGQADHVVRREGVLLGELLRRPARRASSSGRRSSGRRARRPCRVAAAGSEADADTRRCLLVGQRRDVGLDGRPVAERDVLLELAQFLVERLLLGSFVTRGLSSFGFGAQALRTADGRRSKVSCLSRVMRGDSFGAALSVLRRPAVPARPGPAPVSPLQLTGRGSGATGGCAIAATLTIRARRTNGRYLRMGAGPE